MFEHALLDRARMKQSDRVNDLLLPDPIDTADALLEPQRIPWQLDIDDQPALMMKIQSFAGGIGGGEHVEVATVASVKRRSTHIAGDAQRDTRGVEGVAILGEDDRGLAQPIEQPRQAANLRAAFAPLRQFDQP